MISIYNKIYVISVVLVVQVLFFHDGHLIFLWMISEMIQMKITFYSF